MSIYIPGSRTVFTGFVGGSLSGLNHSGHTRPEIPPAPVNISGYQTVNIGNIVVHLHEKSVPRRQIAEQNLFFPGYSGNVTYQGWPQVTGIYHGEWSTFSSVGVAFANRVFVFFDGLYGDGFLSDIDRQRLVLAIPKLQKQQESMVLFKPKPTTVVDIPVGKCPKVYIPVCGNDGKTYGNSCEAKLAGVGFVVGACVAKSVLPEPPLAPPPRPPNGVRIDPVCNFAPCPPGSRKILPKSRSISLTGRPYISTAPLSDKRGRPLTVGDQVCPYECEMINSPVGREQPPVKALCPDQEDLVCGSNGQTYRNLCYAQASGYSVVYKGPCVDPEICNKLMNPRNLGVRCDLCPKADPLNVPYVSAILEWRVPTFGEPDYVNDHCTVYYEIEVLGNNEGLSNQRISGKYVALSSQRNYGTGNNFRTGIQLERQFFGGRGPVTFRIRARADANSFNSSAVVGSWFTFPGSFSAEGCCPDSFSASQLPSPPPPVVTTPAPPVVLDKLIERPKTPSPANECDLCDVAPGTFCVIAQELVCGVNGKTYYHPKLAQCAGVNVAYVGACKPSILPPPPPPPPNPTGSDVCPMVYSPVCGDNGQTYGNSCEARKAGITQFTAGACVVTPPPSPPRPRPPTERRIFPVIPGTVCPEPTDTVDFSIGGDINNKMMPLRKLPVCGKVSGTWTSYEDLCDALDASATEYYEGPCAKLPPLGNPDFEDNCPQVYMPVCGNDGKTYSNSCYALQAGLKSSTNKKAFINGPCNNKPVDPFPKKPELPPLKTNPNPKDGFKGPEKPTFNQDVNPGNPEKCGAD